MLDKPHLDLTTPLGRGFIAFLSAMAEDERHRIMKRANEGRIAAIKRGIHLGRKPQLDDHQRREALKRLKAGESCRARSITPRSPGWGLKLLPLQGDGRCRRDPIQSAQACGMPSEHTPSGPPLRRATSLLRPQRGQGRGFASITPRAGARAAVRKTAGPVGTAAMFREAPNF